MSLVHCAHFWAIKINTPKSETTSFSIIVVTRMIVRWGKVCTQFLSAHFAGADPSFLEPWSNKEYYYSPLDGMLVHCKFNTLPPLPSPPICTSGYKWVREALWDKVSHPRMQHNDSARFLTQTSQPGVQCTDHEATGSPDCYILGPYMI